MSWTKRRLDQLGDLSRGRSRHRPRDAAHLYDGPYPFIQTVDVKHAGLYITEYEQTYSEAGLEQSKVWPAGTLCITIAANIADTAILGFDGCFPDSVIGFIPDENKSDARFVKYLFDGTIQRQVQQFTQGAAQDNLSQEKRLSIAFLVPDVKAQKKIADILRLRPPDREQPEAHPITPARPKRCLTLPPCTCQDRRLTQWTRSFRGNTLRAHGATNKSHRVCARRRDGEAAGTVSGRERRRCLQIVCRSRMALLGQAPRAGRV